MIVLEPRMRRVVYVTIFEVLAIVLSTALLTWLSGGEASNSLPVAVAISVLAVVWNFVFNTVFEGWERRAKRVGRDLKIRIIHAGGFEFGLLVLTLPLYMIWYGVGVVEAFKMEAAILLFFLVFTFIFTWAFDQIFALPNQSVKA